MSIKKSTTKIIVITGASSGLGKASAERLADEGHVVVLGARRKDNLVSIVENIVSKGGKALAIETDVTSLQDTTNLVETAVKNYGRIDVIINNAGVMPLSKLEDLKVNEWNAMIDVNLRGVLNGIAAALPHMIKAQSGHIINVASTAGHRVTPMSAVYSATKHAVRALSEGLRQEMTPHNIRTTIISPGAVSTELFDSISNPELIASLKKHTQSFSLSPSAFAEMVLFAISQPEDVDVNEILFRPTKQEM